MTFGIFKSWGDARGSAADARSENRKANIISNPRITTVDNREAKILVGQKIPLIVQDVAGNPVSQLQTIGIQLKVTPHLTQDKKIIMDLHPEVSDLASQSTVQGGIIINTSEADTRVMVDDGQTAVIGGLIRTNERHVALGRARASRTCRSSACCSARPRRRSQNRELIIFVTPRLIDLAGQQLSDFADVLAAAAGRTSGGRVVFPAARCRAPRAERCARLGPHGTAPMARPSP